MNRTRTRTALAAATVITGLALAACGGPATPTAVPAAAPAAITTTDTTPASTTTTDAPPASTAIDTPPATTTDAPPAGTTTPPTPVPPVAPAPRPTVPVQPAAPVSPAPDTPPPVAPAPALVPMSPVNQPPAPAPAPAPAQPAPRPVAAPVVQAPPPATVASSWSGIYDAFTASHPGPSYRVADTGNFGNTNTNGAGTVVLVSIAPRTPVGILQSVLLHEYAHFRQNRAYGPGLGYAARAVGSPNLDHAADCWALGHGATWVNYGCTNTPAVQGILARMGD